MNLSDDIAKFCKDLILGDFEQQPSNAAMIIGGLVSLIPVVDQVMDVRDVSGMIYRINRKGTKNCTKDDWVDLALAAFGCIPEVGSLFKTIIKPLWKSRKVMTGALRGSAFIEMMLGKSKGAAIKFMKTFNWAGNTQLAIQQTMGALDLCDQFLAQLASPHWWLPDEVEGLARDLKPQLGKIRGPLKTGVQQGSDALREFVTELLGEDGYRVAQQLAGVAVGSTSTHQKSGSNTHAAVPNSKSKPKKQPVKTDNKPNSPQQKEHNPIATTNTQGASRSNGAANIATRTSRETWQVISGQYKAVVGEHMAHYYHMKKLGAQWQNHGAEDGKWLNSITLVSKNGVVERPMELFPEHKGLVNQPGVDGIWSRGGGVYDFVEAKAYESAGMMFGFGTKESKPGSDVQADKNTKNAKKRKQKSSSRLGPPPKMNERELALWCMLGQRQKGLQMSWKWVQASTNIDEMKAKHNEKNRFVYVFFAIKGSSKTPAHYDLDELSTAKLDQREAPGIDEHMKAAVKVTSAVFSNEDVHNPELHAPHKAAHEYSDVFLYREIDAVVDHYETAKKQKKQVENSQKEKSESNPKSAPAQQRKRRVSQ